MPVTASASEPVQIAQVRRARRHNPEALSFAAFLRPLLEDR